jgi:hypothetical protein
LGNLRPADQIAVRKLEESQGTIDEAINKTFDDKVAPARKARDERVALDNAVSVFS